MKAWKIFWFQMLAFLVLCAWISPYSQSKPVSVTGVLESIQDGVSEDDHQLIFVPDSEKNLPAGSHYFIVVNDPVSQKLLKHLENPVRLVGQIFEDEEGNPFIKVERFEVLAPKKAPQEEPGENEPEET